MGRDGMVRKVEMKQDKEERKVSIGGGGVDKTSSWVGSLCDVVDGMGGDKMKKVREDDEGGMEVSFR
jgi:hypothetical protein